MSQNGADAARAAARSLTTSISDPDAMTDATDVDEPSPDDGIVFLADLARAMQATATAEQARIVEATDRRRQLHIGGIRAREAAEADEIHELADEDVKGINTWADGEIKRLKFERERRITARREQLQIRLEEHRAVIAREVENVEGAVATYRSEIDRYFNGLETESDPETIAREASKRPVFPALDRIGPDDVPVGSGVAVGVLAQPATLEAAPEEAALAVAESDVPPTEASDGVGDDHPTETGDQRNASGEPTVEVEATEVVYAEPEAEAVAVAGESDAAPVGIADPDAAAGSDAVAGPVVGVNWDAAEDAAAEAVADDMAGAGNADQPAENADQPAAESDQPAEEAVAAAAEATVVMPRSSGAGSWLRWPNNNNTDRFGPGR